MSPLSCGAGGGKAASGTTSRASASLWGSGKRCVWSRRLSVCPSEVAAAWELTFPGKDLPVSLLSARPRSALLEP